MLRYESGKWVNPISIILGYGSTEGGRENRRIHCLTRSSVGVGPSEEIWVFSLENALPSPSHSPEPLSLLQSGAKEDMDDRLIAQWASIKASGPFTSHFSAGCEPKATDKSEAIRKNIKWEQVDGKSPKSPSLFVASANTARSSVSSSRVRQCAQPMVTDTTGLSMDYCTTTSASAKSIWLRCWMCFVLNAECSLILVLFILYIYIHTYMYIFIHLSIVTFVAQDSS